MPCYHVKISSVNLILLIYSLYTGVLKVIYFKITRTVVDLYIPTNSVPVCGLEWCFRKPVYYLGQAEGHKMLFQILVQHFKKRCYLFNKKFITVHSLCSWSKNKAIRNQLSVCKVSSSRLFYQVVFLQSLTSSHDLMLFYLVVIWFKALITKTLNC